MHLHSKSTSCRTWTDLLITKPLSYGSFRIQHNLAFGETRRNRSYSALLLAIPTVHRGIINKWHLQNFARHFIDCHWSLKIPDSCNVSVRYCPPSQEWISFMDCPFQASKRPATRVVPPCPIRYSTHRVYRRVPRPREAAAWPSHLHVNSNPPSPFSFSTPHSAQYTSNTGPEKMVCKMW